jgi:hypothetical protein
MSNNTIGKMNNKMFASVKWMLTALSGLLTTGLIIILES